MSNAVENAADRSESHDTDVERLMNDAETLGKVIHVTIEMFGDSHTIAYLPIPLLSVNDTVWAEYNPLYTEASRLVERPSVRNSVAFGTSVELVDEKDSLFITGDDDV
jgi:hypothetical protein